MESSGTRSPTLAVAGRAIGRDNVPASAPASAGDRPSRCRFVVTGFGPFRGVPENPTSTLVSTLREDERGGAGSRNETRIFETSAEHVREGIGEIYDELSSSPKEDEAGDDGRVVVLHLGVNYRGRGFQIEEFGYNEATFRIPDERGHQPQSECILPNDESASNQLGTSLSTSLDVRGLVEELRRRTGEKVASSADPGRFVCNYIYCLSLDRCRALNRREGGKPRRHALFVHVPPFDVVPEGRQFNFVIELMDAIEDQLRGGP